MKFAAEAKIPFGTTLSQKPTKCEKCKHEEFQELFSCWKCKSCGKNHGKTKVRIISKAWDPRDPEEWFTKEEADKIENMRSDGRTTKVIDRRNKKTYTEIENNDGTSEIVQERDL